MTRDFVIGPRTCPGCGGRFDGAASLTSDEPPDPGDFSVCMTCGTILRFGEGLCVRLATAEDLAALSPGGRSALAQAQAVVRGSRRKRPPPQQMN